LAERIARRVRQSTEHKPASNPASTSELNGELAAVRRSLSELTARLSQLESQLTSEDNTTRDRTNQPASTSTNYTKPSPEDAAPATHSPWLSGMYVPATHPSEEKFGVEEASIAELVDFFEGAKKCELEPGGKPCDHCAMCNSRGF
jgi:hypothetical protein